MSFKKFHDRKVEEVENRQQSFEEARMFGTAPYSTRQPAAFHYWLTLLERFTPEASKSEVLFEAVRAAYMDAIQPIIEAMTDPVRETCDQVYSMIFQAYAYKCSNSRTDIEQQGGFFATDEAKALAEEFLSDFDSGKITHAELIAKYEDTILNPNRELESE
jgi:hypothetical protein